MFQRLFAAAALAAAVAVSPALAQDDEVLATVNGKEITVADVDFAYDNFFASLLGQMPEALARQRVVELLIDLELMARAAEAEGFDESEDFARRMELLRKQSLQDRYMASIVEREVTDEAVRAKYEELTADFPFEEASASHILVETEEEARDVIAELEAGGDFAELAAERSKDPGTAQRGGALGYFPRGRMVDSFEEAAFAMEPGEVTEEPVQTRFGWHVIRVEDKRTREAPPFEEVSDRIRQMVIQETFATEVDRLRQGATVEQGE